MSNFQTFLPPGNPKLNTFLSYWCFEQKMRKMIWSVSTNNNCFQTFVCCIFPGNSRIIHLFTFLGVSTLPPFFVLSKLFQYILNNSLWEIVVVNVAGQISKQEKELKLFWSHETGWWKTRQEKAWKEGQKVQSWGLLQAAACCDCGDWKWTVEEVPKVTDSSWMYCSPDLILRNYF